MMLQLMRKRQMMKSKIKVYLLVLFFVGERERESWILKEREKKKESDGMLQCKTTKMWIRRMEKVYRHDREKKLGLSLFSVI
mmetsp:Transcript_25839/g.38697  ORF Transcript_25839/g.38697 Transcript_25839/m.38697 type:complete len:82 (-) Transcript_25839:76-321(-)